ncbi:hypothetical protein C0J52_23620 [Blattella germanica]|nr:hypothetical protein C0J52_23620 [Blattella germanica]
MSDIFTKDDAQRLLANKHIMFFGDSNIRALYKDLLCLLNRNALITDSKLKMKLEKSHEGDKLIQRSELSKGRDFVEVRKFQKNGIHIDFQFITRCYNKEIEKIMSKIKTKKMNAPSVIVMNSLLWDISRWGPNGVTEYKDNMVKLLKLFRASLPKETLVIWTTGLPRTKDGIHWSPLPMRHMTNLLLTHIALSWGTPLPSNFMSPSLKSLQGEVKHDEKVVLPTIPPSLNDVTVSPAHVNAFLKPRVEPPWRKRLRTLPTRQLNQENLLPDYQNSAPQNWMNSTPVNRNMNVTPLMDMYGQVMQPQCFADQFRYNKYGEVVHQNNNMVVGVQQNNMIVGIQQNNFFYQQPSYPMQPDYINGPLRQRYSHRNERRHNPYFQ